MGFQILSNIMCVGLLPMLLINMVLSIATIRRASYDLLSAMFRRFLRLEARAGAPPLFPQDPDSSTMNATDVNESNTVETNTNMMDPFPPPPNRHHHHHHHHHQHEDPETYPDDDDDDDNDELRRSIPLFVYDPSRIEPGTEGEEVRVPDLCGLDCSVCLSEFQEGEEIHILPRCNHVFHKLCLSRWLDHEHTTCPLCRMPIGVGVGVRSRLRQDLEEENAELYRRHRERELSEELIFWFSSNFHGSIGFPSFWCHA